MSYEYGVWQTLFYSTYWIFYNEQQCSIGKHFCIKILNDHFLHKTNVQTFVPLDKTIFYQSSYYWCLFQGWMNIL